MRRVGMVLALNAAIVAVGAISTVHCSADNTFKDRNEFAKAMSNISERMTKEKVLALVGRPDDTLDPHDSRSLSNTATSSIWRYGTNGHLTPATLGQIYFDEDERVQYVSGKGRPVVGIPDERILRPILALLAEVPPYYEMQSYNPRKVIQAVNRLQPLGKDQALAVIDEFLRITINLGGDGRDGTFLVLRVLFDVPEKAGVFPPEFYYAFLGFNSDPRNFPRSPIALEGDIPFLLHTPALLGPPPQPESDVAYFRNHGTVRASRLNPSNDPFKVVRDWIHSDRWVSKKGNSFVNAPLQREFFEQAMRLVDSVYHVEPGQLGMLLPWDDDDKSNSILAEASKLQIRWDADREKYTNLDGSVLPERDPNRFRVEIWKPSIKERDLKLTIQRQSAGWIELSLEGRCQIGTEYPPAIVTVLDTTNEDHELVTIRTTEMDDRLMRKTEAVGQSAQFSMGTVLPLAERTPIRMELKMGEHTVQSPVYTP